MPTVFNQFRLYDSHRRGALVSLLCAVAIVAGLAMQHFLGLDPCPLCIAQRMAIIGLGVSAVLGIALSGRAGQVLMKLLGTAAAGVGCYAAVEQLQLIWGTPHSCGSAVGFYMMELAYDYPSLAWLLEGNADCAAAGAPVLGLPLAFWVLTLLVSCVGFWWWPFRTPSETR